MNFVHLQDAMAARTNLNGQEISGSIVKIGFAKVPLKTEMGPEDFLPIDAWRPPIYSPNRTHIPSIPSLRPPAPAFLDFANADSDVLDDFYATTISFIPEPNPHRKVDQNRLRDIRKRVEGPCTPREIESIFYEVLDDAVDLCSGLS